MSKLRPPRKDDDGPWIVEPDEPDITELPDIPIIVADDNEEDEEKPKPKIIIAPASGVNVLGAFEEEP